jgi:hypothetical protein
MTKKQNEFEIKIGDKVKCIKETFFTEKGDKFIAIDYNENYKKPYYIVEKIGKEEIFMYYKHQADEYLTIMD